MDFDEELESMEETGETEAEWTDQETELQDVEDDMDDLFGPEAMESDQEHAWASFETTNEVDYNGYDPSEVINAANEVYDSDVLHSEGYHVEDEHILEGEVIEMDIEDSEIVAYLMDENDEEIGFVLLDENGEEQEYYYVDDDDDFDDEDHKRGSKVVRGEDGEEFDLGLTKDDIAAAAADANVVYKEGAEVLNELKDTFAEIGESFSFLKKK